MGLYGAVAGARTAGLGAVQLDQWLPADRHFGIAMQLAAGAGELGQQPALGGRDRSRGCASRTRQRGDQPVHERRRRRQVGGAIRSGVTQLAAEDDERRQLRDQRQLPPGRDGRDGRQLPGDRRRGRRVLHESGR